MFRSSDSLKRDVNVTGKMPKRKRRGSGRSMGSLKSPRKGLQDVSVEEDENKTEPVVFKFGEGEDEQEMLLDACEVLCCINGEVNNIR